MNGLTTLLGVDYLLQFCYHVMGEQEVNYGQLPWHTLEGASMGVNECIQLAEIKTPRLRSLAPFFF